MTNIRATIDVSPLGIHAYTDFALQGAPGYCQVGARFVDELFRAGRISSVERTVLLNAIWPRHPRTGQALLEIKPEPTVSSPPAEKS